MLSYVERLSLLKALYFKLSTLRLVVDAACQCQLGNSSNPQVPLFDHHGDALVESTIVDDEINEAFAFDGYRELRPQLGENITSVSTNLLRGWLAR